MIINCDSDRFVKEVIEGNEYSYLFRDLTVIDLGCNIGTFSFWIYQLAKEIYAVDIVPEIIDKLNEIIKMNNLDKIKTFCIGITGSTFPRKFVKDWREDGGGSKIVDSIIGSEDRVTPCTTLGQFMIDNNIEYADVVKMDIEALEGEVVNAGDFPKDKIHTIVGELHLNPKTGYSELINIKDRMKTLGYSYKQKGNHFIGRKI